MIQFIRKTRTRLEVHELIDISKIGQYMIVLGNILALSVPAEVYSRCASYPLHLISTVLLLSLDRYLCWWTISPRGYHPPSIQCFDTDMVY